MGALRQAQSHVIYAAGERPSFLATWTSRVALFCAVLLVAAVVLHRLLALPTPIAMTMAGAAFAGAVISLVMAAVAGADIWVTGRDGAARVIFGSVVALGLLMLPAAAFVLSRNYPAINDITTDTADPPEFTAAKTLRRRGANPVAYPGPTFAKQQQTRYSDLAPLIVPRTSEEAYELVLQALSKLRYRTTFEAPPADDDSTPGLIEVADKTLVLGFVDDVVIRVTADEAGGERSARIDVRSASRYGQNDFGRNADRVRLILKEIVGRLEASVPNPEALAAKRAKKEAAKQKKAGDPSSAANRRKPAPVQSGTQRAPARKATQPE